MALTHLLSKISILPRLFNPTITALCHPLPLTHRWRLLALQPLNLLAALLTAPSFLFNTSYTVHYIPTRSGPKRCLIFQPPRAENDTILRPLHIDFHGGGFTSGFAEQGARWCALVAARTGAVVVSAEYRLAPAYVYPAAHDDAEDITGYLLAHGAELGANAALLTLGGSSAGGTLALGVSQRLPLSTLALGVSQRLPLSTVKAWLGFCAPVDLRTRPGEKIKPEGFPHDPLAWLEPLFDSYAGAEREANHDDARCHPTLAGSRELPGCLLFVCAGIDILLHEQMLMVERLREERKGSVAGVDVLVVEKGFHGFVELPAWIMEKERVEVFEKSLEFLGAVHRKSGFDFGHHKQRVM